MTSDRSLHSSGPLDPARVEAVQRARAGWRHEVADLGGANSLLWHRTSLTGTFDLNLAHPGGVAKLLSGRATLLSELVRERGALLDAARRIGAIRDKQEEMRREHGLQVGFLAIGLATWTLHRVLVPPRAPVLLRACTISPVNAAHTDFTLELHEDVVFNPVLEHYLRSEVHLELDPTMLAGLSAQSHGFDPRMTYQALEGICQEMTGFAIGPQMVVGTFPWAKLPLVTSLTGDPTSLAAHDLVAALGGAEVQLAGSQPDPERAEDPTRELSALDADRAQQLVIDEVNHGADLVLDTPAGSGATQTIANVVVGALSEGRSVLVCSEETSTLESLQRRLEHVGLGDLCLHLREDPAGMRAGLATLRRSLEQLAREAEPQIGDDPLPARADALAVLRREQEVLHHTHEPWGLSLARTQHDLAELAALEHPPTSRVRLPLPVLRTLGEEELSAVCDALIEAAAAGAWSRGRDEDPWYAARLASADEAARAQEVVARLVSGEFSTAREQADAVCRAAGMPEPANLTQWQERLTLVARASETLDTFAPQVYDASLDEMVAATAARDEIAERPGTLTRARMRRQVRSLLRPGTPPSDLARRVAAARDERDRWEQIAGRAARPNAPEGWEEALTAFTPIGEDLAWLEGALAGTPTGHDLSMVHLDTVLERLVRLDARADRAPVAATAHPLLAPLRDQGVGELVDDLARRGIPEEKVAAEVRYVHRSSVLDHLTSKDVPQQVDAETVRAAERTFHKADRALLRQNAHRARRAVLRRLRRTLASHPSQASALEKAVERTRMGAVDARDVISRAPDVVLAAQPVLLASQLAVPAVLPPGMGIDLVVVDRAGRTTTARTALALSHARQVLIVGDSGGPGPSEFSVVADAKAEADLEARLAGASAGGQAPDSLLSDAAAVLPVRHLSTHYRAQDQGLVAPLASVMGALVYGFPGASRAPSVLEHVIEGPVAGRVTRVANLALEHAREHPHDSLLIVVPDDATVEDVGLAVRARLARLDPHDPAAQLTAQALNDLPERRDEAGRLVEPFLVRPVSRVAGEVRDRVVWIADPAAITGDARAAAAPIAATRKSIDVITEVPVDQWSTGAGSDLVRLAVHGAAGRDATNAQFEALERSPGSAVLAELTRRLRAEGLRVVPEAGHEPHTVDVAVCSGADEQEYAVAVLSDVQAPAPGAPAPDRDEVRLRHDQLTRLGWSVLRVRSSDVFADPAVEVTRVLHALRDAGEA